VPKICHLHDCTVGRRVSCDRLSVDSLLCRLEVRRERSVRDVRTARARMRSHVGRGRRIVSVKQVVGMEE
jgi:hypothetical protein